MHANHKVLNIFDEKSLQNENITIENSTKEFNNLIDKVKNLKIKIENEIKNIDNLFQITINNIKKSFLGKK